jgi:hypothetical protein
MRLWSLHPSYLDSKGLVALWREGLLALAVLSGRTRGYRHHPQLDRFRGQGSPVGSLRAYLSIVYLEARSRGYSFDRTKLGRPARVGKIDVTDGQLAYELRHLKRKLRERDPRRYASIKKLQGAEAHPLFKVVKGGVEPWEKVSPGTGRGRPISPARRAAAGR